MLRVVSRRVRRVVVVERVGRGRREDIVGSRVGWVASREGMIDTSWSRSKVGRTRVMLT